MFPIYCANCGDQIGVSKLPLGENPKADDLTPIKDHIYCEECGEELVNPETEEEEEEEVEEVEDEETSETEG